MRTRRGERSGKSAQKRLDEMGERRLPKPAKRQGRDGDAQLRGREIGVEVGDGSLKGCCVGPARGDQLRNAASTHRHQGKFGSDEKAVGRYQDNNRNNPEQIDHTAIAARHDLLGLAGRADCLREGMGGLGTRYHPWFLSSSDLWDPEVVEI